MNEEELKVEEVKEELLEETKEVEAVCEEGEKFYIVKTEEFLNDYHNLEAEKEEALVKGLEELDKRVEEKLAALRPEIIEEVKEEIKKEVNLEYDEKLAFYAKYLEEVSPAPETEEELKEAELEEESKAVEEGAEDLPQSEVNA